MSLIDDFNSAVHNSKNLTQRPTNDELLDLYGLYKQATAGDCAIERPEGFDFKAIAKHDAWTSRKGKTKDEAMRDYIALANRLLIQYP
jgi:diazepam-binding inhibitor (GABA receptor modulating acyl-CoA-binding protein)